jgi:hypothetical protein
VLVLEGGRGQVLMLQVEEKTVSGVDVLILVLRVQVWNEPDLTE